MSKYTYNTGMKDRRITIETWGVTQEDNGGITGSVVSSYTMWANIENRDGRIITGENQRQWPYDYKIHVRYESSRPINSSQTVLYDGKRLQINSLSIDREGMREEYILRCSTTGSAGDVLTGPGVNQTTGIKTYSYTVSAAGTSFTVTDLNNKNIIVAFKDGIQFDVILSGIPTGKQVLYSSGTFTWSVSFDIGDTFLIIYT